MILGAPRPTETVSAEAARTDRWQPQISGIGTLTAPDGIDITPQVGGVVKEVKFESGQDVKKGQLLLSFDTDADEAELRSLTAQLANAESDLQRREAIFAKGFAPKADVDQSALRSATALRPMSTASGLSSRRSPSMRRGTAGPASRTSRRANMWRPASRLSGCKASIRSSPISP